MAKKRNGKAALRTSVKAEDEAVKKRFEKADSVLELGEVKPGVVQKKGDMKPPPSPEKVVRDSFTMPPNDYSLINNVQAKLLKAGVHITKGEVLRAGLHALKDLALPDLKKVVKRVEKVKVGRPAG